MPALPVQLRPFEPSDAAAFRRLNEAWIEKYFSLEQPDRELLGNPIGMIIHTGGHIYMACVDGRPIGCCALLPSSQAGVFDVVKMAVAEEHRGRGVGRKLLAYVIEQARALGATRLKLESSDKLANAVHLYESLGFRHHPPEPTPYVRANVFMDLSLIEETTAD